MDGREMGESGSSVMIVISIPSLVGLSQWSTMLPLLVHHNNSRSNSRVINVQQVEIRVRLARTVPH